MPKIDDLIGVGRYLEALRLVTSTASARPPDEASWRTLWAELAQYTGRDEEAIAQGQMVLAARPPDQSLRARCHIAIGEVHRNAGNPYAAMEEYRQAAVEAETSGDHRLRAIAELRILLALADGPGLSTAAAYVPTVRRYVARAGNTLVSCALHMYLGQIEAQRGLLDNAREHIRIGRSLQGGSEQHYFAGVAAVDASCLAFSLSDLDTT